MTCTVVIISRHEDGVHDPYGGAMRRRWCASLLVGATACVACGSDDAGPAPSTSGTSATVPATDPEAVEPAVETTAATEPSESTTPATAPTTIPPDAVVPEGFDSVAATVTLADGTVCDLCLWLADTTERRRQGLMGVTHLGGADGMVFVFDGPSESTFWMRGTPMPLSIAFFDADGAFVSSADMTPCLDGPDDACDRYGAAGPYTTTIEFPLGDVAHLGIGEASRFELSDDVGCATA